VSETIPKPPYLGPYRLCKRGHADRHLSGYCRPCRASPEAKAYMKAYMKAYNATPEVKAYQKAYNATPEAKAYQKAYNATPERKARKKAYNATPEAKAYQKAYKATPERKAYMKAYQKAYNATPKAKAYQKAYKATPEGKANNSRSRHKKTGRGFPLHGHTPPKPADGLCENPHCRNGRVPGKRGLCPDHDHTLEHYNFRAWLCMSCNIGQGCLGENPSTLLWAAAKMLEKRGLDATDVIHVIERLEGPSPWPRAPT
jgi:recombination endonuclease VII